MTSAENKLRGGYYTPDQIADFLCRWAIRDTGDTVLEPSCGDGAILGKAAEQLQRVGGGSLLGVELIELEAHKASKVIGPGGSVEHSEFFSYFQGHLRDRSFDAVVGNPPFIRYQHVPEEHRQVAFEVMKEQGLHPNRLTNLWLPFVVAGTAALNEGGRLALVIPAELMQVTYAAELRAYLARHFSQVTLVTFKRLVFEGVLQEVVLLLAEGAEAGPAAIRVIEVEDAEALSQVGLTERFPVAADMDHATEKWTQYYLSGEELSLVRDLRENEGLRPLGARADVDVGVVTGRNEFFVMTPSEATKRRVPRWTSPLVGRSSQLPGIHLTQDSWEGLRKQDAKCLLLDAPAKASTTLQAYIDYGEENGFHEGYKCRIRKDWHVVPSVWSPDAFLLRQIYDSPRLILNGTDATSTDTIHRVRLHEGTDGRELTSSFYNSLTFAFAEIMGRSYGGGVLELEPTEAEALPVPDATGLDVEELDRMIRVQGVQAAVEANDRLVLGDGMGLSSDEIEEVRGVWIKLMERRLSRNGKKAAFRHTAPAEPSPAQVAAAAGR